MLTSPNSEYNRLLGQLKAVFFLGIGGIGMSAIARYFKSKGYAVAGYDRTSSALTQELEAEGIGVIYSSQTDVLLPEYTDPLHTLIVRTPAVPAEQEQLQYFMNNGFCVLKRAEVLGMITRQMQGLCVAGTHGKTTTSTILAHLMFRSDIGCNAFLGGISNNYGTNLLLQPESNYVVIEADEYDRSFHQLSPYMAIITSCDADHLDIYGDAAGFKEGFEHFTSLIKPGGALVMKHGLDIAPRLQKGVKTYTYCGEYNDKQPVAPDFYADNIKIQDGEIHFDFITPTQRLENLKLGVPVYINIENSVAAMAVAWLNGVNETELRNGLASYNGIYRRFNIHINTKEVAYIDDYAHHPTEIQASISSIRRLFPDRKLIGVFQPHLYTRTRDFKEGFSKVLSTLDEVVLLPIYPAREEPIEGVDSQMLLREIKCEYKHLVEKNDLVDFLRDKVTNSKISDKKVAIITIGAGDIDRLVEPIRKMLISLSNNKLED